jgi:hypothetical protein
MTADIVKRIVVYPGETFSKGRDLLDALATIFPVRFSPWEEELHEVGAVIVFGQDRRLLEKAMTADLPILQVPIDESRVLFRPTTLKFVNAPLTQPALAGRAFTYSGLPEVFSLRLEAADRVILTADGRPIWAERRIGKNTITLATLNLALEPRARPLALTVSSGGWVRLWALFHFLREATADLAWQNPGLSACFMFDDPNLHWRRFGFLDYDQLAQQAQKHQYHAAIATVPLDLWWSHSATVQLFRRNAAYLSLLMHGVDHTKAELARFRSPEQGAKRLAQGLHRVQSLERRQGLQVDRIMAPPHHACSIGTADLLLKQGIDGLCVSTSALMKHNPGVAWPAAFGLRPVEFIGNGLPVMPRFNFADQDEFPVHAAAFFGQPIIPMGHHADVADGLDILARWAEVINGLGSVYWGSVGTIAQRQYQLKVQGDEARVRMLGRHVVCCLPEGVRRLVVERPWLKDNTTEDLLWKFGSSPFNSEPACGQGHAIAAGSERRVELCVKCALPDKVPAKRFRTGPRLLPLARRVLCEGRDRLAPCLGGWSKILLGRG